MIENFPDRIAVDEPDKPAYILGDTVVSYAELVRRSIKIANVLYARGLRRGDVVAVLLPNMPGYFEVVWACQRSGLRYTAVSTRLNAGDVTYILDDSGAKAVFSSVAVADRAVDARANAARGDLVAFSLDAPMAGFELLADAESGQPDTPEADEVEGGDLLYSSGTTGRPKGVAAPMAFPALGTMSGIGPFLQQTWGFGADSVYLSPAPLYHAAPLRFSMTVQRFGGTVIVMSRFDAQEALTLLARHRVTHTQMVPTMLVRLLQCDEGERRSADLSSLKALIHAAAPCPPAVKRAMIEWVGPIVDEYYSGTENNLMTFIDSEQALRRPGSVGRPIMGTPHILDDDGAELPPGVPGAIWSSGGMPFEYLNDPAKTAESRNERGWTTVGDIGYLDEDGYLYISDRRADLIIVGGVNVYPLEAENVLIGHPAVSDVAVIGVPTPELGAEVRGVVALMPDIEASDDLAAELIEFCTNQLSRYKCPRAIDFVSEIPRTPTGKLMRREVRERYLVDVGRPVS